MKSNGLKGRIPLLANGNGSLWWHINRMNNPAERFNDTIHLSANRYDIRHRRVFQHGYRKHQIKIVRSQITRTRPQQSIDEPGMPARDNRLLEFLSAIKLAVVDHPILEFRTEVSIEEEI